MQLEDVLVNNNNKKYILTLRLDDRAHEFKTFLVNKIGIDISAIFERPLIKEIESKFLITFKTLLTETDNKT